MGIKFSSNREGSTESSNPATRRYSRASAFTHWMDNIKDKKVLKIKMDRSRKVPPGADGKFKLYYLDISEDGFMALKGTYEYKGTYKCLDDGVIEFEATEIVCKLQEDGDSMIWKILPSDEPDGEVDHEGAVKWPWDPTSVKNRKKKVEHFAPPSALKFTGEDNPEGNFVLRIQLPQLAAGWTPPCVTLSPTSGWELVKNKSLI